MFVLLFAKARVYPGPVFYWLRIIILVNMPITLLRKSLVAVVQLVHVTGRNDACR